MRVRVENKDLVKGNEDEQGRGRVHMSSRKEVGSWIGSEGQEMKERRRNEINERRE